MKRILAMLLALLMLSGMLLACQTEQPSQGDSSDTGDIETPEV